MSPNGSDLRRPAGAHTRASEKERDGTRTRRRHCVGSPRSRCWRTMIHAVGEPAKRGRVFTLTSPFIVALFTRVRAEMTKKKKRKETRARARQTGCVSTLHATNENVHRNLEEDVQFIYFARNSGDLAKATRLVRDNARRTLTAHPTQMHWTTTTPDAAATSRGRREERGRRAEEISCAVGRVRVVERPPIATGDASAAGQSTRPALVSNTRAARERAEPDNIERRYCSAAPNALPSS